PVPASAPGQGRECGLLRRRLLHPGEHGPRRAAAHPLERAHHARVAGRAAAAAGPGGRHRLLRPRPRAVGGDAPPPRPHRLIGAPRPLPRGPAPMTTSAATATRPEDDPGLAGRVAIVTGGGAAGDGIGNGRAACILLARSGTRVL